MNSIVHTMVPCVCCEMGKWGQWNAGRGMLIGYSPCLPTEQNSQLTKWIGKHPF